MGEIIVFLLGVSLWLTVTGFVTFITLVLCGASLLVGAIGGFFIGLGKGVLNYFAAIREELTFSQV